MTAFFLIWQDPDTRRWLPVGKLERFPGFYTFVYTVGSLISKKFSPFGRMNSRDAVYVSQTLFPIFANRVMNAKRPEYNTYASWSDMEHGGDHDPLMLMARMGGGRVTDTLQVYHVPEDLGDSVYRTSFFLHGISRLPESSQHKIFSLQRENQLFPMLDLLNPHDTNAVSLRTDDPTTLIGYCPRHLAIDIQSLMTATKESIDFRVSKVNFDAPKQFRLLCKVTSLWPHGFKPCDREEYVPLAHVRDYDNGPFVPSQRAHSI